MEHEVELTVDGHPVRVPDRGGTLLDALRDDLRITSVKDGCSPQGQCGCCTVLVDGQARVSCVTPLRRVAGRSVTTLDGLDPLVRDQWAEALTATGGSQCGFCTPGIICRLAALGERVAERAAVDRALAAHLCRCTGWQTIVEAAVRVGGGSLADVSGSPRDPGAAARRAELEGSAPQRVGPQIALGRGGFADDVAPPEAGIAVRDDDGVWHVADTLAEARDAAGRVQGRNSTTEVVAPLEPAPGSWDLVLATSWVEPAYLETDTAWCEPGGEAVGPVCNGGAFGAKNSTELAAVARRLADELDRPIRVRWTREDVVMHGAKRPPLAAALRSDGTGIVRVAATEGIAAQIAAELPDVRIDEVELVGPRRSSVIRGAGWVEAAVLRTVLPMATASTGERRALARTGVRVSDPNGATATVRLSEGGVAVTVECGDPLDEVVLRSFVIGAVHMALGWVCTEGLSVGADGVPRDLTIRSFGVLRSADTPHIEVAVVGHDGEPVAASSAVVAATAAAVWLAADLAPTWPLGVLPNALLATLG